MPVVHPENREAGIGEAISRSDHTCQTAGHLTCSDLGSAQTHAQLSLRLCGVPEYLNLSGLDLGSARNTGPVPCRATWNLSSVDWESTHHVSRGKPSVAKTLRALPTHTSDICLQCSSLPTAGLSRASLLWTGPSPARDRQVRAARARRGQLWPQRGIIYQTARRLCC